MTFNPRTPLIVLTALATAAAPACSDSGGSSDGLESGDGYSVRAALAELPASIANDEDDLTIRTGDLATASELAELERPSEADDRVVRPWIGALSGLPGGPLQSDDPAGLYVPLATLFTDLPLAEIGEFEEALGWSLVDVDAFVERSSRSTKFTVLSGDFDEDTLNPELTRLTDDVVSLGEGEDGEFGPGHPAHMGGIPLRLAHHGDRIAASRSTPLAEEWAAGMEETLADDASLAAVADALDEASVVAAMLSPVEGGLERLGEDWLSPAQIAAVSERVEAQIPAAPFDAAGIGWGLDDGDAAITVAYHFADDNAASASVDRVRELYSSGDRLVTNEPMSNIVSVEDAVARGSTVTVSLSVPEGSEPLVMYAVFVQRDLGFTSR